MIAHLHAFIASARLYSCLRPRLFRERSRERGDTAQVVGTTNGWIDPVFRCMHCETLQIFTKGMGGEQGDRVRGGLLGLGILIGAATFAFAKQNGCSRCEILAIRDDDYQHSRLVRYYKFFGFKEVKQVSEDSLGDVSDRLLWGGVGTRMDADVEGMLRKWTPALRSSTRAA